MKNKSSSKRTTMPWYMALFMLLFVAILFFDFEHRQKQRFEDMNAQMEKLATILRTQQQGTQIAPKNFRGSNERAIANPVKIRNNVIKLHDSNSVSIKDSVHPSTYSRGNNTHIFWRYADQSPPENVYRFIGTVDVTALAEAVRKIPEDVWAEGDERSQKYKVHQYTHTLAFRLAGDHLREMQQRLQKFEGKQKTYDILNFDDSMTWSHHWSEFEDLIQPILDHIAGTFPNKDRNWLRVLLVRLDAGKSVSQHRDNGAWMRVSRRIHVPIITHEKVTFHVSDMPKGQRGQRAAPVGFKESEELMPVNTPGNIVELNNAMTHFVNNDAPIDRVHLIVDYLADLPNELSHDEAICIFTGNQDNCLAL